MDKGIEVLNGLLFQIEQNIRFKDKTNTTVSIASVGWQLGHSLKVINRVCNILEKTKPHKYKRDSNLIRSFLFTLGYIPRGRAKTPKVVNASHLITIEDLHTLLESAKTHIKNIEPLHKKAFFTHHIFGTLSKAKTIRFLEIHTKHHLKIVNDILK